MAMTIKEFQEKLSDFPPNSEVIFKSTKDQYYSLFAINQIFDGGPDRDVVLSTFLLTEIKV